MSFKKNEDGFLKKLIKFSLFAGSIYTGKRLLEKFLERREEISKGNFNYFIVFQDNKFEKEKEGEYLLAPKLHRNDREVFHWDNINKLDRGDIVFSIVDRKIKSVSIVINGAYDEVRDGKEYRKVDMDYNELTEAIEIDNHIDNILKLSEDKYAAFDKNGDDNIGYIFETGRELGEYLFKLVF